MLVSSPGIAPTAVPPQRAELERLVREGRYAEAEEAARGLLAEASAGESQDGLDILDVLVEALWRGGKAREEETRELAERAVAIREDAVDARGPGLARSLDNLGIVLFLRGDYSEAREVFERARRVHESALTPDLAEHATVLNHLAAVLQTTGELSLARRAYEEALAIQEETLGSEHADVGKTLNNLATLLKDVGDFAAARRSYERALAIVRRDVGETHPLVAVGENNLGELLHRLGDYERARELYERALSTKRSTLGPDHPSVALTLGNLGELDFDLGHYERARSLNEEALRIQEEALGPDHPDLALGASNLAKVLARLGDPGAAKTLYERALALREKALGEDHPLVADVLFKLAFVYRTLGDDARALRSTLRAEEVSRNHLRLTARFLPERQALAYASARVSGLDLLVTIGVDETSKSETERIWNALVRSRALVLDEMIGRHRAAVTSDDERLARLVGEYRTASERLANLSIRGPAGMAPAAYRELVREARTAKETAERRLAEASAEFRAERAREQLGFEEVQDALPEDGAVVAYARYEHWTTHTEARPSYAAFVFEADVAEPRVLPLGPVRRIEDLVRRWRDELVEGLRFPGRTPAEAEQRVREAGSALRDAIWSPVARALEDARTVFVVPDGALHLVNLGALPGDGERYLVENGRLVHYLSTERDLVVGSRAHVGESAEGDLFLVGGADFDGASSLDGASGAILDALGPVGEMLSDLSPFRGGAPTCEAFRSWRFAALEGSALETEEIAGLWRATDPGGSGDVLRLTGSRATETAVKGLASHYRVVHLATHGFFLGGRCTSFLESGGTGENPLLLSGIALAGANQRHAAEPGEEDGILTAQEIGALDLSGVDWVVLSGCDTGLGEIRAGEGVMGLRRALRVAGVSSVIMSLWPVEDRAAHAWMGELYSARLNEGAGTAEAVRAASLEILRRRRDAGDSTHPFYWGAFVAAGDWE